MSTIISLESRCDLLLGSGLGWTMLKENPHYLVFLIFHNNTYYRRVCEDFKRVILHCWHNSLLH